MEMQDQPKDTLGRFLRRKRESLKPEDVGLPIGHGLRRTPGLRREEVSEVSGISHDYLTKIERDCARHPSVKKLCILSSTLKMTPAERLHLFDLADKRAPEEDPSNQEVVSPAVLHLIHALPDIPCYIMGRSWDTLAWNHAGRVVFGFHEAIPSLDRNIAYLMFGGNKLQKLLENWEFHAQKLLGFLRSDWGRFKSDQHFVALIKLLKEDSTEFAEWWELCKVHHRPEIYKVLKHTLVGRLTFEQTAYEVADTPGIRMCLYRSVDEETKEKVRRLTAGEVVGARPEDTPNWLYPGLDS